MGDGKRHIGRVRKDGLRLVATSESFQDSREPDFRVGDLVRLNSGGPIMLVVDVEGRQITTSWKSVDGIEEWTLPRPCFHRTRDAW